MSFQLLRGYFDTVGEVGRYSSDQSLLFFLKSFLLQRQKIKSIDFKLEHMIKKLFKGQNKLHEKALLLQYFAPTAWQYLRSCDLSRN